MSRSSNTLRSASSRLAVWRSRLEGLLTTVEKLAPADRAALEPALQPLRERFGQIETRVRTLSRLEDAWSDVGANLQGSLRAFDVAFEQAAAAVRRQTAGEDAAGHRR